MQDQSPLARRYRRSIEQGDPVLWLQDRGLEAGASERLRGGQYLAVIFGLPLADQNTRHGGEKDEVAGPDGADRAHNRIHAGIEKCQQGLENTG